MCADLYVPGHCTQVGTSLCPCALCNHASTVLQAPCCDKLYVCRLCHDAEENHQMDRFKVREVQCSACLTVQEVMREKLMNVFQLHHQLHQEHAVM